MTDIIKKKNTLLNLVRTRSYTVFHMKKQKNRKNLISDAALKAKMKEQPWWQKKN